jgi:hypothetical protein
MWLVLLGLQVTFLATTAKLLPAQHRRAWLVALAAALAAFDWLQIQA